MLVTVVEEQLADEGVVELVVEWLGFVQDGIEFVIILSCKW